MEFFLCVVFNAQPSCHSLENRSIDRHHTTQLHTHTTTHRAITPLSRLFHNPSIKACHLEKPASVSGAFPHLRHSRFYSVKDTGVVTSAVNPGLRSAQLFISSASQTGKRRPISDQKLEGKQQQ